MADTLFPLDDAAASQAERPRIDFFNLYAVQKAGMPVGWRWFSSEVLNYQAARKYQSFLLCGAVVPNIEKGKYAGQPKWKGRDKNNDRSFSVSVPALEAFYREWEIAEGKCHTCLGTGEAWAGWSKAEGTRYKPCPRCGATGRPPAEQAGAE